MISGKRVAFVARENRFPPFRIHALSRHAPAFPMIGILLPNGWLHRRPYSALLQCTARECDRIAAKRSPREGRRSERRSGAVATIGDARGLQGSVGQLLGRGNENL